MTRHILTQNELKELLHYCQDTGILTWIRTISARARAGQIAGWQDSDGYKKIGIKGLKYKSHRLAWLFMTGRWPLGQIDHIDRNKANNKWVNLREATASQNQMNKDKCKNNNSGFKGVKLTKATGKWQATVQVNYKSIYLGTFETAELASKAYDKSANGLHNDFYYKHSVS